MTISSFDTEDVMLDIETLALSNSNSVILSIGMVAFDPSPPSDPLIKGVACLVPSVVPQILKGRLVSPGTVSFWQGQPPEASKHFLGHPGDDPAEVCDTLRGLLKGVKRLWANGILFDLGNVTSFYEQFSGEKELPWHYQAPSDMRTFCRNREQRRHGEPSHLLVAHDPISDCITQIYRVWSHWDGGETAEIT